MASFESSESNTIEVNGVRFEILLPERMLSLPKKNLVQKLLRILKSALPIPSGDFSYKQSVQIGIRITNNTSIPVRFSFYFTLFPELVNAEGQVPLEGGWISPSAPLESDFPLAMPGESLTFFPNVEIFWIWGNRFGLSVAAGNGGEWIFQPLKPGIYQFRFTYNNPKDKVTMYGSVSTNMNLIEEIWTGQASTPFVELHLAKI